MPAGAISCIGMFIRLLSWDCWLRPAVEGRGYSEPADQLKLSAFIRLSRCSSKWQEMYATTVFKVRRQ